MVAINFRPLQSTAATKSSLRYCASIPRSKSTNSSARHVSDTGDYAVVLLHHSTTPANDLSPDAAHLLEKVGDVVSAAAGPREWFTVLG